MVHYSFHREGGNWQWNNHYPWPSPLNEFLLSSLTVQEGPGLCLRLMVAEKWCVQVRLVDEGGKIILGASSPHDLGWPRPAAA